MKLIVVIISLVLFILPFLFGSGYSVGGDDARLYYLFPKEYLSNYLFHVMSANSLGANMGYMAVSYAVPFVGLFFFIKTILPIVNVQLVFYGLNLSFGFLFCFLFFRMLDITRKNAISIAAILASCLYVTSPYLVKTLYQHELISIYLVMLVPLFFYTFTRGLQDKNMKYIVGSAVSVALLSSSLLSVPWFLPLLLVCIPYLIYCAFRFKGHFWKSVLVFVGVSTGLHWYWLVHGLVSIVSSRFDKTLVSLIISNQFIQDAQNLIYSMVFLNGPIHQIAGYIRTSWEEHQQMSSWNLIGSIPILLASLAGIKIRNATTHIKVLFGVVLTSFVVSLCMVTPNMGKWNMDLFLFLTRTVPLFAIFRNMYDKFGLAMAFICAWTVFLSMSVLLQSKQKIWTWISLGLGIVLLIYQAPPFLQVQGMGGSKQGITHVSSEYQQLITYLSSLDTTKRFVWYPMTFPGYTPIQDEVNKNSWYLGLSPLQILAGKSDVVGFYGLQTAIDPNRNWQILELLKEKKYEDIISILASYNIGYVITINEPLPDDVVKKLDQFSFITLQSEAYKHMLLGEKIHDIGTTYSIYTINPKYTFDTAFLTNNPLDIRVSKETVSYRKIKTNVYEITIPTKILSQSLVLLTPYHLLWKISVSKDAKGVLALTNHRVAYDYGNVWDIQRKRNLTVPVTVTIEFIPDRLTIPSLMISCIFFIGCCVYICYPKKRT